MLGSDLVEVLDLNYEVLGIGSSPNKHSITYLQTDITNQALVFDSVKKLKPAIIIHAAAYTDVDGCELNPHKAFQVNVKGTEFIARAANEVGSVLFLISTDYVFDGAKATPYVEIDTPSPISVYGRSKWEAEGIVQAISHSAWIIRSSWLFGANGKNFFRSILQHAKQGTELSVVNDQTGAPTYTKDLAQGIQVLIEKGRRVKGWEIYHLANDGQTTWHDAAVRCLTKLGVRYNVKSINSKVLNRPAKRPANSIFDMTKIRGAYDIKLRSWDQALDEFSKTTLKDEWKN